MDKNVDQLSFQKAGTINIKKNKPPVFKKIFFLVLFWKIQSSMYICIPLIFGPIAQLVRAPDS